MNTKTLASIVIIIVAVAAVVGLFMWHNKHPEIGTVPGQIVETPSGSKFLITKEPTMVKVDEDSYLLGISGSYPQFAQADASFNAKIEKTFTDEIAAFKQSANEDYKARLETGGDEFLKQFEQGGMYFYEIKTDVVQSNDDFISVVIHYGGYTGGAHPFQNVITFNYDVKLQKELNITDFVTLAGASKTSRQMLMDKFKKDDIWDPSMEQMLNEGTIPTSENFQNFTFIPNQITIYFGQYQVGPYALGEQQVTFDPSTND